MRVHEWLSEIPWSKGIFDTLDINKTRSQLEKVLERILKFLAIFRVV
ncbi:37570_t:CDS:2 [Gigaspora margarita]|uniref:37570_t:CDS:1 n=1 Tax=Gigaspora margarita TaxID=4874 RepID=A0ABN7WH77_GIGMA|nr:37570_t:CDS:2 [Gigaspora margarita]